MRNPEMNEIPPVMDKNDEPEQETWYSITLDEKWELPKDEQKILQKVLLKDYSPLQAAFIRDEGSHATLYLTPYCQGLALAIRATKCERPSKEDNVRLYIGDENAKRLLE